MYRLRPFSQSKKFLAALVVSAGLWQPAEAGETTRVVVFDFELIDTAWRER